MVRKSLPAISQRRLQHAPQAHVQAIFVGGHPAIADLEHVRVVPVARLGMLDDLKLSEADALHRFPAVADVEGSAPQIAAGLGAPLPHVARAVIAEAIDDGAAGLQQCVAHLLIGPAMFFPILVNAAGALVLALT
jgi:hypothetical protein